MREVAINCFGVKLLTELIGRDKQNCLVLFQKQYQYKTASRNDIQGGGGWSVGGLLLDLWIYRHIVKELVFRVRCS